MMKIRPIKLNIKEISRIRKIFINSFPIDERPPFYMVLYKALRKDIDFLVVDDGEVVGLAYMLLGKDYAYLFFLAVMEEYRNKGRGSKTISLLKEYYPGYRLMLALEQLDEDHKEYELRKRRRVFYQRNGFKPMDYVVKEGPVVYDSMSFNGYVNEDEYLGLFNNYFGWFDQLMFRLLRWGK